MASHDRTDDAPSKTNQSRIGRASSTKLMLTPNNIRELYEAARSLAGMGGSPYLNRLFDAQTALSGGQLDRVGSILTMTRSEFEKSHFRILRFQPTVDGDAKKNREDARLAARKEQVEETLRRFDEYLTALERMVDLAARAGDKVEPQESPPHAENDLADLPPGLAEAVRAAGGVAPERWTPVFM